MPIMQNALEKGKCLLHHHWDYAKCMTDSPANRLKAAREAAGFTSAKAAAEGLGVPLATYTQHENGTRGIPRDKAPLYARRFKVSEEWLLYGKGRGEMSAVPSGAMPVAAIPLLGAVPGGNWREAVRTAHHYIPAPQPGMPSLAYALTVEGNSMDRVVHDGAQIIIDPEDRDLFDKWFYVVRNSEGEVTFKQYREKPARLVPCSTDPSHQIIPVADRDYEIVGRVILITMRPDQATLD